MGEVKRWCLGLDFVGQRIKGASMTTNESGEWVRYEDHAAELEAKDAEIVRLRAALDKVNAIRNSIVGCQTVNFSEHVYPLAAALDDAGFAGETYAVARENVGTLIQANARLRARVEELEGRLVGVAGVLSASGCDCDCGHDSEGHDESCDRCVGCRVWQAGWPALPEVKP